MNAQEPRPHFFNRHPWLYVAFAFLLLLGAWSALITIAAKHSPQAVEISRQPAASPSTR